MDERDSSKHYIMDRPVSVLQLTAQAIAHQEAVQRQLAAVERDRLGAGLHGAVLPR